MVLLYDPLDRLTEIEYVSDAANPDNTEIFQIHSAWQRAVAYWQTNNGRTSIRDVGTDETGRPLDMVSYPSSGAGTRVWSINPSAWGFDTNVVGSSVYQPLLFAGQYMGDETVTWLNNGTTMHQPGVVLDGPRTYDPFTGSYLQVDPEVPSTRSSYVYADDNPILVVADGPDVSDSFSLEGCEVYGDCVSC